VRRDLLAFFFPRGVGMRPRFVSLAARIVSFANDIAGFAMMQMKNVVLHEHDDSIVWYTVSIQRIRGRLPFQGT